MQHLAKCDDTCAPAVWGLNTALRDQLTTARTVRGENAERASESVAQVGALVCAAEKSFNDAQSTAAAGSSTVVSVEDPEASARRRQARAAELAQLQHGTTSLSVDVKREREREQFLLSQIHQLTGRGNSAQASLQVAIKAHGLAHLMSTRLAKAHGLWYWRALATGTAWAGLYLIHHNHIPFPPASRK